jgi:hypothetical protein
MTNASTTIIGLNAIGSKRSPTIELARLSAPVKEEKGSIMLKESSEKPTRNRIDLSTKELARHWCKHLGASQVELEAAMAKVGDNAETVLKELRSKS